MRVWVRATGRYGLTRKWWIGTKEGDWVSKRARSILRKDETDVD